MSIIQRIKEYVDWKDFEAPLSNEITDSNQWPTQGKVEIKNLSIKYRKGLPFVLKNLSFTVQPKTKVAMIGRTGSGKSTLLLALMRIIENVDDEDERKGSIEIDGLDIADLGLYKLRHKITIIPQDPYLFEGTLRFNVDPLGEFTDEEIIENLNKVKVWETLLSQNSSSQPSKTEIDRFSESSNEAGNKDIDSPKSNGSIELLETISNGGTEIDSPNASNNSVASIQSLSNKKYDPQFLRDMLEMEIESKGKNLSLGQRQLICIARALICKPKILLMDEATANIDQRTDAIIQGVIKNHMKDSTVITIAHRLVTIIQYDKLVVLKDGVKEEEGSPLELIKSGGLFCQLVEEGGDDFKRRMISAAKNRNLNPLMI